jgi:hypothetical protein
MALFDTTKQQSLYPGLSPTQGVVDRSGLIDDSSLTTLVGLGSMGLDAGISIDKENVMNEANNIANQLADDYLDRSPSEQMFLQTQKQQLESDATSAPDEVRDGILKQLDDVNARLTKAKSQGMMDPYEYQRRVIKASQDLAADNPAYANEISANVNKTLNRRGVNDVLQSDMKIMLAQQKRREDQYNHMIKTIEPYVTNPYALSEEQLASKFLEIKQADVASNTIERLLGNRDLMNSMKESDMFQIFKEVGPQQFRQSTFNNVTTEVKAILNDPNLKTYQDRVDAGRQVIENYKEVYIDFIGKLPQDKEQIKTFVKHMDAMFNSLEKQIDDDFSLKGIKEYTANKEQIYKNEIQIGTYQKFGTTLEAEQAIQARVQTINALRGVKALDAATEQTLLGLVQDMLQGIGPNQRFKPAELDEIQDPAFVEMVSSSVKKLQDNPQEGDYNFLTSYLKINNERDPNGKAAKKLNDFDVLMKSVGNLNPEAFNKAYNNAELKEELVESVSQYRSYIELELNRVTVGKDVNGIIDPVTGLVTSDDPVTNKELNRMNAYIKIRSRMERKEPKDVVQEIINKEFNNLELFNGN